MTSSLLDFSPSLSFLFALKRAFSQDCFKIALGVVSACVMIAEGEGERLIFVKKMFLL